MLLLASFSLFILTNAAATKMQGTCDYLTINNINYEKQLLLKNVTNPSGLSIDYDKSILFYSYTENDDTQTVLKTAYVNLKTLEVREIATKNLITSAVDNKNHKVYLGGKTGIYEFDYNSKKLLKLDVGENSIWQIFYKDGLYFTTFRPEEQAFYFKDSNDIKKFTDSNNPRMRVLGIDNDSNIYFGNSTGLFYKEKPAGKTTLLIEDIVVNAFNSDINGELYFSTPSSLHHIKTKIKTVETLFDFHDNSLWGFAIDENGNIIYGSDDSIIKLVPTSKICENDIKFLHI